MDGQKDPEGSPGGEDAAAGIAPEARTVDAPGGENFDEVFERNLAVVEEARERAQREGQEVVRGILEDILTRVIPDEEDGQEQQVEEEEKEEGVQDHDAVPDDVFAPEEVDIDDEVVCDDVVMDCVEEDGPGPAALAEDPSFKAEEEVDADETEVDTGVESLSKAVDEMLADLGKEPNPPPPSVLPDSPSPLVPTIASVEGGVLMEEEEDSLGKDGTDEPLPPTLQPEIEAGLDPLAAAAAASTSESPETGLVLSSAEEAPSLTLATVSPTMDGVSAATASSSSLVAAVPPRQVATVHPMQGGGASEGIQQQQEQQQPLPLSSGGLRLRNFAVDPAHNSEPAGGGDAVEVGEEETRRDSRDSDSPEVILSTWHIAEAAPPASQQQQSGGANSRSNSSSDGGENITYFADAVKSLTYRYVLLNSQKEETK